MEDTIFIAIQGLKQSIKEIGWGLRIVEKGLERHIEWHERETEEPNDSTNT